jgi:cyclic pyranopterin phosphate synthase
MAGMNPFTHFDERGAARMVDVGGKAITARSARATGQVHVARSTRVAIDELAVTKGDVFQVARLAAIQAAKQTPHLIPLCHSVRLTSVDVGFAWLDDQTLEITVAVGADDRTGVEMEALTGAAVAALTVYDMCKALDREMTIGPIRLVEKTGGRGTPSDSPRA